ncbi:MAG TPA: CRTAC1 family protein [Candidatus Polarisedimenticolia bacterium]|nr:CRTAC1 family protein [Candidatus Polarisedimenticolia bacterium]
MVLMTLLLGLLAAGAPSPEATSDPLFADVSAAAGLGSVRLVNGTRAKEYILETTGTGVAAFDFDNDGWQDLYIANSSTLEGFPAGSEPRPYLFRNRGDGVFEDVGAGSGLTDASFWGSGVAVGDYDNDGFTDLYVTAWGPDRLYRNRGDGTFEDVTRPAGVANPRWGASAAFADFDNDGDLDLFAANYVAFDTRNVPKRGDTQRPCLYRGAMVMCGPTGLTGEVDVLYRNNGDGTFSDVTGSSGIRTDIGLFGLGVAVGDYDMDGDVDLYVANDATPNQLYRNRGDGTFEEVGALSGVAYGIDGVEMGSMGTAFGDYDGDGRLDLIVTNFSHQFFQLLRGGDGYFEDVSYPAGVAEPTWLSLGWATDFVDFDNDADLDLFFANGHVYPGVNEMQIGSHYEQPLQILRNEQAAGAASAVPGGRWFTDVSARAGSAAAAARSRRAGGPFDFDRDGDMDLVLTVIDDTVELLRNDTAEQGGWAAFRLHGKESNRSGLGAVLTARVGDRSLMRHATGGGSYLWGCDARVHFGLGAQEAIDSLEIRWPSGRRQKIGKVKGGADYLLVEGAEPVEQGRGRAAGRR